MGITTVRVRGLYELGSGSVLCSNAESPLVEASGGVPHKLSGYVDLSKLAPGGSVVVALYVKVRPGGAWQQYHQETYTAPLPSPVVFIEGRPDTYGLKVTVRTVAGPDVDVDYEFFSEM